MPVQGGVRAPAVIRVAAILAAVTALVSAQAGAPDAQALRVEVEGDLTDTQLEAASSRRIRLGPAAGSRGAVVELPLEVYVARVLAGEGSPRAAGAAQQALAIAIRTFALANLGRHARDGFDLCNGTHCQVPRAATAASRRSALATAGRVLTYAGAPAELFYSASCGGHSESAGQVWPGINHPYLQAAPDDVHDDEAPWRLVLTLDQVQRALAGVGFEGRLRDVRVEERSASGRAARLAVPGLSPNVIAGEPFRAAIGTTVLRSTAFAIERRGTMLHFTGRGYGHGVGLCVIGAGRRAARGETAAEILARYYPGLVLAEVAGSGAPASSAERTVPREADPPPGTEIDRIAAAAHASLSAVLGVSLAPIAVRVHDSIESFRQATGQPWWVTSVAEGTSIDLLPPALVAQRDGLESAIRTAVAELLVGPALAGRPRWVRVGAARHFARHGARQPSEPGPEVRCPSDAELTLAISAAAQRAAEARAEACFARAYARTRNWRSVR